MSDVYILIKDGEAVYTYSRKLRDKYKAEGYKLIFNIHGWNVGITKPRESDL